MTYVSKWLTAAAKQLSDAGIATARLDCLVLLEDVTGKDRTHLLAHPEDVIAPEQLAVLNAHIARRAAHEPLAYIRGKTEFYGREFLVSAHTLEPRPETEDMVDCLKELKDKFPKDAAVADVGTGSGAIGITAALELGLTKVDLIDIDKEALKIARQNVRRHGLKLTCRYGDLLTDGPHTYEVILANLPYVPDSHTINAAAMQEPRHAIFGGPDGLDLYRRLFAELKNMPTYILTEALPFQHRDVEEIAYLHGYVLKGQTRGFIQVFEID